MTTDERERQFERALARHLGNSSGDSGCPDAEILAAYHERTLSLSETARLKEHIVSCVRCQQTLALVEQSEQVHAEEQEDRNVEVPVEEMAASALRVAVALPRQAESQAVGGKKPTALARMTARRPLRWAVPIGAIAAGVIVWVAVHERGLKNSRNDETFQMAKNQQTPPIEPRNAPESPPQKQEQPNGKALDAETGAKIVPPPTQPRKSDRSETAANIPAFNANESDHKEDRQKDIGGLVAGNLKSAKPNVPSTRESDRVSRSTAPAIAAKVEGVAGAPSRDDKQLELKKKAPTAQQSQSVAVGAAAQPATPPITTQAVTVEAPKPSTASQSVEVQPSADLQQQITANTVEELSRKARNAKAGFLQTAAGDRRYVVTPDEHQAWQVGNSGEVLRTTNFGKTWKAQKSGVEVDLTSGSAPSRDVCWLIGKAGTILLTTDGGKHWKRVTSPVPDDLGSVVATDALHATVSDATSQKTFKTIDGGETWTSVSQ